MSSPRVRIIACAVSAVLAIALVLGYASSVRSQAASARASALARYGGETARVCVTTAVVARGETFSERNVTTVDWLVDLLPEGAQTDASQVLGKVAASTMAPNTPVSSVDLEAQASVLDVPAGTTAVSVPCSAENAVGGALAPGSVVDVYLVSEGTARLLCPGVRVLQTSAGAAGGKLSWVTIAAAPERVEAIVAAANLQRLSFVLPSEDVARSTAQATAAGTRDSAAPDAGASAQVPTADDVAAAAQGGAAEDGGPAAAVQTGPGTDAAVGDASPVEPAPEQGTPAEQGQSEEAVSAEQQPGGDAPSEPQPAPAEPAPSE